MCGLLAYYKTSNRPVDARLIEDMTNTMTHRGPDDYGFCFVGPDGPVAWRNGDRPPPMTTKGVAMGHRRFSVFDLTEAGRQPFLSTNKHLAMVFNGEIYNYLELRDELGQYGYGFSTDCDSEVLLTAFEHWGTECFLRFNGVWSIVIWDNTTNELVVARDRLGQKPLLYTQVDGDWIFASEIKALLAHPKTIAQPNEQTFLNFIATGSSPLAEVTFFANINSVSPGTFRTFRDGQVSQCKYWNMESSDLPLRTDEAVAAEELDSLLTDAVKLRLRGDVRVGAMLSGGLDSTSVITSIATVLEARLSESRSIGDTLQAFTASYPGMEIDETDKVEELCRSIEIDVSQVFPVDQDGIEERLNDIARKMEIPFWSPAIIVHDSLMQLVRSSDVRIVLDGLGADEIFAGYDWHLPVAVKDSCHNLRMREAVENLNGMHSLHGRNYLKEITRTIMPKSFPTRLDTALRLMNGQRAHWDSGLFQNELCTGNASRPAVNGNTILERDLKNMLLHDNVPRWVHMGDNIAMANSIAGRSPFLDHRLIEFAFSLDNSLKIRKGVTKYILRESKRDQLPPSIVNAVRKIQFSGLGQHWLNGPLKAFALSLRDNKNSKLSEFLRTGALTALIDDFFQSKPVNTTPAIMWRILNSEAWLRAYF